MVDYQILQSSNEENELTGQFIDAHAERLGVVQRTYDYHVQRDGRCVAGIRAWALGPDVHIDLLGVEESERRSGYGSILLKHVEALAKADGCTTASVDTFSFQAPDFYPRHGYQVIFRYPLDDGTERVYFSKRL